MFFLPAQCERVKLESQKNIPDLSATGTESAYQDQEAMDAEKPERAVSDYTM